jgi:hypothetical protein
MPHPPQAQNVCVADPKISRPPDITLLSEKRFIPIIPALPNGLKDVLQASRVSTALPADSRNRGLSLNWEHFTHPIDVILS